MVPDWPHAQADGAEEPRRETGGPHWSGGHLMRVAGTAHMRFSKPEYQGEGQQRVGGNRRPVPQRLFSAGECAAPGCRLCVHRTVQKSQDDIAGEQQPECSEQGIHASTLLLSGPVSVISLTYYAIMAMTGPRLAQPHQPMNGGASAAM